MSSVSRTSQAVAMVRAGLDRPVGPDGDATAQHRLCAGMPPAPIPAMVPQLRARTRFVDDALIAALAAGTPQVVSLGAGYDDRALRFPTAGVRYFEVDHPSTQADKRDRLRRVAGADGPILVAADFGRDDAGAALHTAGHDATVATLFICEGLLVYLDEVTIGRLLASLRARAGPGSRLVASLAIHDDGLHSAAVVAASNAARRGADAEPWRTILPAAVHRDLLRSAGWHVVVASDVHTLEPAAPPGRSLLVAADPVY